MNEIICHKIKWHASSAHKQGQGQPPYAYYARDQRSYSESESIEVDYIILFEYFAIHQGCG